MAGLPFFSRAYPSARGERITLKFPTGQEYAEWAELRGTSRQFLERWEPKWASDELGRPAWRTRIRRYREEHDRGTGTAFLIYLNDTGKMAGGISIGNIRRGVAQSAQIGYWMGERHAGRGIMLEALRLASGYGFETLGLHRIEAACIPGNTRSMRVLEKAGFTREGLLRSYLKINGTWQDHYLYALIVDDYRAQQIRGKTGGT
ncbi:MULTISPECIES: GNAT family N-acetyltransferase [Nitratireductor]|uniref:GNAT family N-acetyltransferase n=1 Tax=Nitratireductor TaxID=245876 RepID=UPI000D0CC0C6|nr:MULTISPECIES: GNAT family protein [Nitratireductor]PSM18340.1 30S ribosomal protein S5 alanine N-acetyltransferase [Nitratireductor sp. StC3]